MKSNEIVMSVMFLVMGLLAAGFMYAMFRGDSFDSFEMSRLYFAAGTMVVLAWIFILSMIFYFLAPGTSDDAGAGKVIFETCVKVIPPIATLIIGFYFGVHSGTTQSAGMPKPEGASAATGVGGEVTRAPAR